MMNAATVLVFCGLPGSGKTTLARRFISDYACPTSDDNGNELYRIVHVEYDGIARELHETCEGSLQAWRTSRVHALEQLDHELRSQFMTIDRVGPATSHYRHLVILMDDNFHLRSMRKQVYRICQTHVSPPDRTIYLGFISMDTPYEECIFRNRLRAVENRIPEQVLQKMRLTWEPPDSEKASWEASVCRIQIGTAPQDHQNGKEEEADELRRYSRIVFQFLEQDCRRNPVLPRVDCDEREQHQQSERELTNASILHRYDRILRSWVGQVAQIHRVQVEKANRVRKCLLVRLKDETCANVTQPPLQQVRDWFVKALVQDGNDNHAITWTSDQVSQLLQAMSQLE